ncbi:hypothetical protein H6P81_003710 [Aristolochia fimbriata]|uniref:Ketose-bisphosphate aldolase class-II family protein n=1 Tax=Aristolochia fimbriata TaxID=158543 RepID=A0AAV7FDC9_ARIFI|nr:hypothetical protein H6P81_003710 [Aristolochia fimbriata]
MASGSVVGFVGLDELGLEMAASLIRSGYRVQAFEPFESTVNSFSKLGGIACGTPTEAVKDATIVIVLRLPVQIAWSFRKDGLLKDFQKDGLVIVRSMEPLAYIEDLEKSLTGDGIIFVVDAYVFKGVIEPFKEKIVATLSGKKEAIARAQPVFSAMCEKAYILEGHIGAASKTRMIIEMLEAMHFVASTEAMFLGTRAGVHPKIVYDIISHAAGSSWIFANCVPEMLEGEYPQNHFLNALVDNVGIILHLAKSLTFPLPILTIAHQQLIYGSSYKSGDNTSSGLVKVGENLLGVSLKEATNAESYSPVELANQIIRTASTVKRIGFIGLGAMGFGMATHLLRSNFSVIGYDVYPPSLSRFSAAGGSVASSPADVSKDVDVLVLMVTNEAQAESVLFGNGGSVAALPVGASIILSSTVSPGFVTKLEQRLRDSNKVLKLVDAPVSGGVKRAADGTLTIMAAGSDEALESTGSVLSALSENLYVIKGGCGAGSCVKMINQLLAGVHIAVSAEVMAFGARLGLNTRTLFDVIKNSQGTSWMFENRVPHMLDDDYTPYSALDIFVKDLGIVCHEGACRKIPLHLSSIAHQQFLTGSAAGWGRNDDAAVVKVYENFTGVKVAGKPSSLNKQDLLKSLPPEWPEDPIDNIRRMESDNGSNVLVVLDDDPTGTQTVHDIDVLTEWSVESLVEQFNKRPRCFFILTNSRALSAEKANFLTKEICRNIDMAAETVENVGYTVVLRSDSTLRGHFPEEADAASSVLGEMDAWIICPFFLQGGRYTVDDIHYVADSDRLIPAGETEFAKDASFGYKTSNLCEWVEEKTRGRVLAENVASVSIQLLRSGGPSAVCEHLCSLPKGSVCVVNAASERDMTVFASGMIEAEGKGKRFLCRTAASFVSARIGIKAQPPISPKDLEIYKQRNGGLIIVGSYVPKTTKQVEALKTQLGDFLKCIEVSVDKVAMKSLEEREEEITQAAEMANVYLQAQKDTLIMTSRLLITGKSPAESLEINFKVSSALVDIVRRIKTRPRYILAKGGITSSDIATKALEAKRARVAGQALAGVPLWQLGPESRHPSVPYIVFPGNVGDNDAVAEVVKRWANPGRLASTKDLLLNAESGQYAIGAFNVYNLEGVEAVVAAAEEERSPAILQIHPGALKEGGVPLIACCISAAEQSKVPITVHFDHGSCKDELLEVLELGFHSVMVDGSHLPFKDNIAYTKFISSLAHSKKMLVEAELGRLSGTEDGLTVEDYEAWLTDVSQAEEFIDQTHIDALAVCIGNVHGKYPAKGSKLRLDLLKELNEMASRKGVSLVLHGASGLPGELIQECISLGVRKFNVNTEVRNAYLESLRIPKKDLVHVMASAKKAMKAVIVEKMRLFGSAGKA